MIFSLETKTEQSRNRFEQTQCADAIKKSQGKANQASPCTSLTQTKVISQLALCLNIARILTTLLAELRSSFGGSQTMGPFLKTAIINME